MTDEPKVPIPDDRDAVTNGKAALIDPVTLAVLWTNAQPGAEGEGAAAGGISLEEAVPLADALGLRQALRAVADTGISQDLRANLVSTSRGAMVIVVSIHRLPDGKLLVLTENTWSTASRSSNGPTARSRRRTR